MLFVKWGRVKPKDMRRNFISGEIKWSCRFLVGTVCVGQNSDNFPRKRLWIFFIIDIPTQIMTKKTKQKNESFMQSSIFSTRANEVYKRKSFKDEYIIATAIGK